MYIKLDKEYEVKTTFETIHDIEKIFDKSFYEVINMSTCMRLSQQIDLLYVGFAKANDISKEEFEQMCSEYLNHSDLVECLGKFLTALQYQGLSEDEIQERIKKKISEIQALNMKKAE